MTTKKIKGPIPSLITLSNGKPEKVVIKKKSKCSRCHIEITIEMPCFGIPKSKAGFKSTKRHCKSCFAEILNQSQKDLDEAKNLLNI